MQKKIILQSLIHSLLTAVYVLAVAFFMSNAERMFDGEPKNFWAPMLFLLLFVLSATIVGTLILGRPILMYLNGAKNEAIKFLSCELGWLFAIILTLLAIQPWR